VLLSCALPLVANSVTLMADIWFRTEVRVLANAVGSMAYLMGAA